MTPDLGFVSLDEVINSFMVELRRIEDDYRKNGIPRDLKSIIEDIDCIRSQLLKRARDNFLHYVKSHPEVKAEMREAKKAEDQKKDTRDWKDRVSHNRQAAIAEALRG